jgi:hypothetical protein
MNSILTVSYIIIVVDLTHGHGDLHDHFVYVVTDGKGGVGAAVIAVQIGS